MRDFLNPIKEKINNGEIATGFAITLSDPQLSELVGLAGCDFVWIDGEHGAMGRSEMVNLMIGAHAGGAAAFVRVNSQDPRNIRQVLDMGPEAIVFPLIGTADDARQAVAACTYPPHGVRGFCPIRASKYGSHDISDYYYNHFKDLWRIMIIETLEGSKNIEEIVQVEGVDAVVLGYGDLSVDMGLYGQFTHPDVQGAMAHSAEICRKYNKPILYFPTGSEDMKAWIKNGAKLFSFGFDAFALSAHIRSHFPVLKKALQEVAEEEK